MRMTREERRAYEDYMVSVHAAKDVWDTAKEDGWREGHVKGIAEGRAEGLSQGRAEGRAEGIAETARKMKADGIPTGTIAKYTGLTPEEIEAL